MTINRAWFAILATLIMLGADEPASAPPIRGVLVVAERATPELLSAWKARGVSAVVVPLDETIPRERWADLAATVDRAGLGLYPWIEVARNPAMADGHPDWMAAPGGHHDDWRRLFPDAPKARPGEVIKAWPWVPIGYAPAFDAHRDRINRLVDGLPGPWAGLFLNDLQAGPSSCGCGNSQCRWALDYGSPATAPKAPGDDAAARLVAGLRSRHPGKVIIPVWVTECEQGDLPDARGSSGLCGGVACARGDCWPHYARQWNPLVKATDGPIALAAWSETFHRDADDWIETASALFQHPPRGGTPLPPARSIVVLQGWNRSVADRLSLIDRARRVAAGWVLALDPVEQGWGPRIIKVP